MNKKIEKYSDILFQLYFPRPVSKLIYRTVYFGDVGIVSVSRPKNNHIIEKNSCSKFEVNRISLTRATEQLKFQIQIECNFSCI